MKYLIYLTIILIIIYIFCFFKVDNHLSQDVLPSDTIENKIKYTVKLLNNNKIEALDLEEYIVGVISCEMPASFEIEALKANAVAARTYALKKMNENNIYDLENSTNNQCYINTVQMKDKWKDNYDYYYTKILTAVKETEGKIITYNDEVITAFYFSTSNGYTENSENVFSQKLEYLRSVDSYWDENTKTFYKEVEFEEKNFLQLLNINSDKVNKIEIISRSNTGRVNEIKINENVFKGTIFRTLLALRSTDFEIDLTNGKVKIKTKGYGHGVGLSQYGANEMAKLGYNFEAILKHYYTNIEIKNV